MLMLPYLTQRQIGPPHNKYLPTPSFDNQFSQLKCTLKSIYLSYENYQPPVPPIAIKFRKDESGNSKILAVANEDGYILIYDTFRNQLLCSFVAHNNCIFDFTWIPRSNQIVTACGDTKSFLLDVSKGQVISKFRGHISSVKTIDLCKSQPAIFATGSKDATICIFDNRTSSVDGSGYIKPVTKINCLHPNVRPNRKKGGTFNSFLSHNQNACSLTAVTFQNENMLASSGAADGVIKFWDLRKTYVTGRIHNPKYQITFNEPYMGHGCTSLVFNSTGHKLYGCCTSHRILQFDSHSHSQKFVEFTGLEWRTYFLKLDLSWDDQYLVCGSSDNNAYIWKTSQPGDPFLTLKGHTAETASVAFAPNDIRVATSGDDNQILVWTPNGPKDNEPENKVIFEAKPYVRDSDKEPKQTNSSDAATTSSSSNQTRTTFRSVSSPPRITQFFSILPSTSISTDNETVADLTVTSTANNSESTDRSEENGSESTDQSETIGSSKTLMALSSTSSGSTGDSEASVSSKSFVTMSSTSTESTDCSEAIGSSNTSTTLSPTSSKSTDHSEAIDPPKLSMTMSFNSSESTDHSEANSSSSKTSMTMSSTNSQSINHSVASGSSPKTSMTMSSTSSQSINHSESNGSASKTSTTMPSTSSESTDSSEANDSSSRTSKTMSSNDAIAPSSIVVNMTGNFAISPIVFSKASSTSIASSPVSEGSSSRLKSSYSSSPPVSYSSNMNSGTIPPMNKPSSTSETSPSIPSSSSITSETSVAISNFSSITSETSSNFSITLAENGSPVSNSISTTSETSPPVSDSIRTDPETSPPVSNSIRTDPETSPSISNSIRTDSETCPPVSKSSETSSFTSKETSPSEHLGRKLNNRRLCPSNEIMNSTGNQNGFRCPDNNLWNKKLYVSEVAESSMETRTSLDEMDVSFEGGAVVGVLGRQSAWKSALTSKLINVVSEYEVLSKDADPLKTPFRPLTNFPPPANEPPFAKPPPTDPTSVNTDPETDPCRKTDETVMEVSEALEGSTAAESISDPIPNPADQEAKKTDESTSPGEKENKKAAKKNGSVKRKKSDASSTPKGPAKRGAKSRKSTFTSPEQTNSIKNYFSPASTDK